jgi:hypothetical protein
LLPPHGLLQVAAAADPQHDPDEEYRDRRQEDGDVGPGLIDPNLAMRVRVVHLGNQAPAHVDGVAEQLDQQNVEVELELEEEGRVGGGVVRAAAASRCGRSRVGGGANRAAVVGEQGAAHRLADLRRRTHACLKKHSIFRAIIFLYHHTRFLFIFRKFLPSTNTPTNPVNGNDTSFIGRPRLVLIARPPPFFHSPYRSWPPCGGSHMARHLI